MLPVGLQGIIKNDCMINNAPAYDFDFLDLSTSGDHLNIGQYFLNDKYYNLIPRLTLTLYWHNQTLERENRFTLSCRRTNGNKRISNMVSSMLLALDNINYKNGCLKIIPKVIYLITCQIQIRNIRIMLI